MWHSGVAGFTGVLLNCLNRFNRIIHDLGHFRIQLGRIVAFNKVRLPAHAFKVLGQIFIRLPGEDRWVRNLEPVHMNDWQNRAIANRIDEGIAKP